MIAEAMEFKGEVVVSIIFIVTMCLQYYTAHKFVARKFVS